MNTNDLTGAALDWAVAKCEGKNSIAASYYGDDDVPLWLDEAPNPTWEPSTNWSQGGPIIERECIDLHHQRHGDLSVGWTATIDSWDSEHSGPTPLVAAMRCYVAFKMGDTVELPEGLTP